MLLICEYVCRARSFNQDISDWNVSYVTNMNSMFSDASSFNQDVGDCEVSASP